MESSALVLLSGGMDSTTLLHYVMKDLKYSKVEVILFDYGQHHVVELEYAKNIAKKLCVPYKVVKIDLSQFKGSSLTTENGELSVVVPARNSVFLSLATAHAEVRGLRDVFFASNLEDFRDFPDCRGQFIRSLSKALSLGNNIRGVYAPFTNMTKKEIVKLGKRLGVSYEDTWSCYFPVEKDEEEVPCGVCHACIERNKVLSK